jgi:hypothetical protein
MQIFVAAPNCVMYTCLPSVRLGSRPEEPNFVRGAALRPEVNAYTPSLTPRMV